MPVLRTVGELKRYLIDVDNDTPLWTGGTVVEGGLTYFDDCRKYEVEVDFHTKTFGIALPREQQRTETGLVFW